MEVGPFSAPEVLRGATPEFASDVYSFGILSFEVLSGKAWSPGGSGEVRNNVKAVQSILQGERPDVSSLQEVPEGLCTLLCECWDASASKRPAIGAILSKFESLGA